MYITRNGSAPIFLGPAIGLPMKRLWYPIPASPLLPLLVNAFQNIPAVVRSIGNLSGVEMGRLLRYPVTFPSKDLPSAGMVHCHLWPGHFPPQQCHRIFVSTGEGA